MNTISKISPWTAKPLSEAAKNAKFRAVMDLAAERVILGRSAIVTGWVIGGVGVACFAALIFGWVTLLPLKTSEVKFFLVDKSTGIIGEPVGLQDAPRIFGAAVERQYLKRYIEAREGWLPEMDERSDHVTKLMSIPDEQARYAAGRDMPMSPVKALGKDGHVSVDNFRFHPLAIGKDRETRRYLVQFDRTVWRGATRIRRNHGVRPSISSGIPNCRCGRTTAATIRADFKCWATARVLTARTRGGNDAYRCNAQRRGNAGRRGLLCRSRPGRCGGLHAGCCADPGGGVFVIAAHRNHWRHRPADDNHLPARRERLSGRANRQARQERLIGGRRLARGSAIRDQGHAARQQPDLVAGDARRKHDDCHHDVVCGRAEGLSVSAGGAAG